MTPDDILAIAREGNPKVIAAILNRSTRAYGFSVRVSRDDRQLHVLIEGAPAMNQTTMVSFVQLSLKKLKIEGIETVKIYGRQTGHKSVAWSQEIALRPSPLSVPSSTPPASPVTPSPESTFSPSPAFGLSSAEVNQPDSSAPAPDASQVDFDAASSTTRSESPEIAHAPQDFQETTEPANATPSSRESNALDEAAPTEAWSAPPTVVEAVPEATTDHPISADQPTESAPAPAELESFSPSAPEPALSEAAPNLVTSDTLVAQDQGTFEHPDFPGATVDQAAEQIQAIAPSEDAPLATSEPEPKFNFRTLVERPEAVVLVLFLLALYIWQFYESLMAEVAPEGSLSGRALAARLQVSYSTISRRRETADFSAWTQSLDPDGIAWVYVDRVFVPNLGDLD
ncbi:MAG: hypothetical protein VKK04_20740 [Synechococcales bacterium]|nr:hypothetical protein [Synechococcales bacterium]